LIYQVRFFSLRSPVCICKHTSSFFRAMPISGLPPLSLCLSLSLSLSHFLFLLCIPDKSMGSCAKDKRRNLRRRSVRSSRPVPSRISSLSSLSRQPCRSRGGALPNCRRNDDSIFVAHTKRESILHREMTTLNWIARCRAFMSRASRIKVREDGRKKRKGTREPIGAVVIFCRGTVNTRSSRDIRSVLVPFQGDRDTDTSRTFMRATMHNIIKRREGSARAVSAHNIRTF